MSKCHCSFHSAPILYLENDNTIMTLKTICEKVGHKPTRLFEYGAMRTAIEACAARTEPCVENTKLSTGNHAQSVFRPRQFRLRLVEANKTEPTAVNFWRNKCAIRIEKEQANVHLKLDCVYFSGRYSIIYIPLVFC